MKRLGLLLVFCFTGTAHAVEFNYTGHKVELHDVQGFFPGGTNDVIGGPAANNRLGVAQQFTIGEDTQAAFLNVDATIIPLPGTTTFQYKIYTGSTFVSRFGQLLTTPIPIETTLAFISEPLTFTSTEAEFNAGVNKTWQGQIPFEYTFNPGTYWISQEGIGGTLVKTSQSYEVVATPEPSSYILMFIGMIFLLFVKRRSLGFHF